MGYEFYCYVDQKRTRLDVMPRDLSHKIKARIDTDAEFDEDGEIMYRVTIDMFDSIRIVEYFKFDVDAYDYAVETMTSQLDDILYYEKKQKEMVASLIDYASDCGHDVRFNEHWN